MTEPPRPGTWYETDEGQVLFVVTAAFYTAFTALGSVAAQYFLMTRVERGKRRVGGL